VRYRVLVSAPYAMPVIDRYRRELEAANCEIVVAPVRERLNEKELLGFVPDVDGIICGDDEITARVLDAAPRLKVISKWGTGIDSIDQDAARARGVAVRNTPNAFSEPVADTTLGYMLMFARRLDEMTRDIRSSRWEKPELVSLRECTLGIVGVGNCGKAVARRAVAFGMKVLGHDRLDVAPEFLAQTPVQMVPLDRLLAGSDFVTLHTDLNPSSRYLMDDAAFARMKPTAFLINTSRGPVVREASLVRALETRRLAGAALDVFEKEPLPADSPLRAFPNVFLAPHNANSSREAKERVHQNTLSNLIQVLQAS
jgi:D-3-phosphoglycerate dehydrogenase